MRFGRLIARLILGAIFIGHGTQKWFGWFDGPGLKGTRKMVAALDMRPVQENAIAVSASETIGGAMVAAGALTPVGASALIATMITAIRKVHFTNGLWNADKGYEFNLALIAALLVLIDGGPGPLSVDRALGIECTGSRWALATLATGAAGSALAIEAGRRRTQEERSSESEQSAEPVAA
jgi:putative oxidoreductase